MSFTQMLISMRNDVDAVARGTFGRSEKGDGVSITSEAGRFRAFQLKHAGRAHSRPEVAKQTFERSLRNYGFKLTVKGTQTRPTEYTHSVWRWEDEATREPLARTTESDSDGEDTGHSGSSGGSTSSPGEAVHPAQGSGLVRSSPQSRRQRRRSTSAAPTRAHGASRHDLPDVTDTEVPSLVESDLPDLPLSLLAQTGGSSRQSHGQGPNPLLAQQHVHGQKKARANVPSRPPSVLGGAVDASGTACGSSIPEYAGLAEGQPDASIQGGRGGQASHVFYSARMGVLEAAEKERRQRFDSMDFLSSFMDLPLPGLPPLGQMIDRAISAPQAPYAPLADASHTHASTWQEDILAGLSTPLGWDRHGDADDIPGMPRLGLPGAPHMLPLSGLTAPLAPAAACLGLGQEPIRSSTQQGDMAQQAGAGTSSGGVSSRRNSLV